MLPRTLGRVGTKAAAAGEGSIPPAASRNQHWAAVVAAARDAFILFLLVAELSLGWIGLLQAFLFVPNTHSNVLVGVVLFVV